ncbi:MAG: hypothetical protein ABFE01_29320 [Phycisphaerales bacterium]
MIGSPSAQNPHRSNSRLFISILLVCVLLAGAGGIAFVWLMIQPTYIVSGMVKIAPVVYDTVTGEARPEEEIGKYEQFVNTQAMLLMNDEKCLQRIVDDLARRNLAFFSGKPTTRIEKLLAKILPQEAGKLPDEILRRAIADEKITAGYLQNSELMEVTMKSPNGDEARTIVNSFLRNYVGQYSLTATTNESQNITVLEGRRDECQKRILEAREKIHKLVIADGTASPSSLREAELQSRAALQTQLTQLESERIRLDADIGVFEKTEKLEMTPEQVVAARAEHISSDPLIKELVARIAQTKVDLIVAGQTAPADAQREAVLKALQQNLEERRKALAEEFDANLENKLKEAARQRVVQAKAERTLIAARIVKIRDVLGASTKVVTDSLDIQDLQRKLAMDEDVLSQVNRRLQRFEMERDRRPRVVIASLAEVKDVVDPRWRWTLIIFGATVVLSVILAAARRATKS